MSVADDSTTALSARATDAAGNDSACSNTIDYTEDSTAPNTTIDTGPSGTSSNNDPSFSCSSDEPGSSFECRLDGPGATTGSFADCTPSPRAYIDLADGAYTFSVRATDTAGTVDASPDTRSFSVDTGVDNPPVAVSDTATVAEDSGATSINVRANDTDIDGGPKRVESVTQPANGTVAITAGGSGLTYKPNPYYCNDGSPTDGFTYTLNGGSTATVTVAVSYVITGTPGRDVITGTPGDDVIICGAGNDKVDGGGGNDVINRGAGNDTVRGGSGNDILNGEDGSDTLYGWERHPERRGEQGHPVRRSRR